MNSESPLWTLISKPTGGVRNVRTLLRSKEPVASNKHLAFDKSELRQAIKELLFLIFFFLSTILKEDFLLFAS